MNWHASYRLPLLPMILLVGMPICLILTATLVALRAVLYLVAYCTVRTCHWAIRLLTKADGAIGYIIDTSPDGGWFFGGDFHQKERSHD